MRYLLKIWKLFFLPMVHRCKKCSDISEMTSGGRAEIENIKNDEHSDLPFYLYQQMLLLKCHCTPCMERLAKWLFVRFWKDCLLAELQAKMSRGCRFLLFWHHSYEVTLTRHGQIKMQFSYSRKVFHLGCLGGDRPQKVNSTTKVHPKYVKCWGV